LLGLAAIPVASGMFPATTDWTMPLSLTWTT
jgi:hypothetical protein